MSDAGHAKTEKEIAKLEKRIREVYSQAEQDILEKMDDFNRRYKAKESIHLQELKDGKITQEQFDSWKRGQVFQGEQWKAKRQQIADTLYNANKVAINIVNDQRTNIFSINANYQSYQMEHDTGVNFGFDIYDSATVARLLKDDPQILPERKVNASKDKTWNKRNINNCVVQGIIQGESLDKIAKRISKTTGNRNRNTMLTAARTSMTAAQNAGRVHSLQHAKDLGINVVKEWMATLDAHTRDSHARIDGEKVPVGDKWHPTKFSNGCRYPGDPEAPAHEVYNCRCTMVGDITDYPAEYQRYDNIAGKPIKSMSYKEWEKAKEEKHNNPGRGHVDMTDKNNYTISKIDWVITDTGLSEAEAEKVLSAIRVFTSEGYDWVIEHPESDQYKNMYDGVEKYINKAPKWNGGSIERGIRIPTVDAENMRVGQKISQQNKASSWTTSDKLARKAATNKMKSDESGVIFHMDLKIGETVDGASVAHLSKKPQEQEVILSGDSEQTITSITEEWITKKKRIFHIYVREN